MAVSDQRVIATAGILSVAVGSANSILKDKRLPSTRFLIGSGVAWLILSALAEGEPELAKGLALGVLTTIVLGEGGGVLSYISHGEIDTQKPKPKTPNTAANSKRLEGYPDNHAHVVVPPAQPNGGAFRPDSVAAIPGLSALPNIHH